MTAPPVWEARLIRRWDQSAAAPSDDLHGLVWRLFPGLPPGTPRPFLFEAVAFNPLQLLLRATVAPTLDPALWDEASQIRPFAPQLHPGQRLRFRMRVVASQWQPQGHDTRSKRQDVITMALKSTAAPPSLSAEDRAAWRSELVQDACSDWLERQGQRCGFLPDAANLAVMDFEQRRFARGKAHAPRPPLQVGAVLLQGCLEVTDPALFVPALTQGFGAARAFGHGLMQIAPLA